MIGQSSHLAGVARIGVVPIIRQPARFPGADRLQVDDREPLFDPGHPQVLPAKTRAARVGEHQWPVAVDVVPLDQTVDDDRMRARLQRSAARAVFSWCGYLVLRLHQVVLGGATHSYYLSSEDLQDVGAP